MPKFEVQTDTICDGWVNTWHEYDDDNEEIPMTFDSFKEALDELDAFLYDMEKAFNMGDIEIPYNRNEYRIVKVNHG